MFKKFISELFSKKVIDKTPQIITHFSFLDDDGSNKTLQKICANDDQYHTALDNEKYREFLVERYNEHRLREYFYSKYEIEFSNIYLGEVRIDWDKFTKDLLSYAQILTKEELVLVIYSMLITVARKNIRSYTSNKGGWENIWSEQCFNQIKTVITLLYDELTPVLQKDNQLINTKLEEIRETLLGYCNSEDDYWIFVFEHIEKPLREILNIQKDT